MVIFTLVGGNSDWRSILIRFYITDESGKRGYCLDKEKSSKNVTSDPRLSFLHTAYLSKHPLVVDSLYEKWQLHLKQQSLSGTFALQLWYPIKMENITESVYPSTLFFT